MTSTIRVKSNHLAELAAICAALVHEKVSFDVEERGDEWIISIEPSNE